MLKKWLRKIGLIKPRKLVNPNGRPKLDITSNTILSLKKEGFSNRQIAKKLGVTEGTVRNRIKEYLSQY